MSATDSSHQEKTDGEISEMSGDKCAKVIISKKYQQNKRKYSGSDESLCNEKNKMEQLEEKLIQYEIKIGQIDKLIALNHQLLRRNEELERKIKELDQAYGDNNNNAEECDDGATDFNSDDDDDSMKDESNYMEEYPVISKNVRKVPPQKKKINQTANKMETKAAANSRKIKNKPPILVCYNADQKDLTSNLISILGHKNFSLNNVNKNVTHVNTSTVDDYNKTKNFLKTKLINFYTFTVDELKPYSIIIKKLSQVYDESEVLNYLNDLELDFKIVKLKKLNYNWLIQLTKDSNLVEFKNIKYILNCKIQFENFKQDIPIQCKNCQRFSHVASNCNMPYRCVKCGESHGPQNCKIPLKEHNNQEYLYTDPASGKVIKRIGIPVKCINCGTAGHTANAKNCPKRLEILKKIDEKKMSKTINVIKVSQPTNSFIKKNETFASKFKNTSIPQQTNKNSHSFKDNSNNFNNKFEGINSDCKRLLGKDFFNCLSKIENFSTHYSTLTSDQEKSEALFNLFLNLRLNA